MGEIALQLKITDVVAEYDRKVLAVSEEIADFERACVRVRTAGTVQGTWGETQMDTGNMCSRVLLESLKKSAWRHVYRGLSIEEIAPAKDKRLFEQAMSNPPDFTMDNIRATFGDYIADPWSNILRGLAEAFCDLDPAYKSHDKVKIGVAGLPKRVILSNVESYGSWGQDRLKNILNALASYQRKPLITYRELTALMADGLALKDDSILPANRTHKEEMVVVGRGIWLKRFANGNGHLFFDKDTLKDINRALAEYYGEVLPDCYTEKPDKKKSSTEVSKDLQYYPTPQHVIERMLSDINVRGKKVLEPSCGCGRILEAVSTNGGIVFGIEYDPGRAAESRAKGHNVLTANFLETVPVPKYDFVVMNPPFYGTHYGKHIEHALKFLKDGGTLVAVLPVTARYDHGIIDKIPLRKYWNDLPVGSFRESGTNINTTILLIKN